VGTASRRSAPRFGASANVMRWTLIAGYARRSSQEAGASLPHGTIGRPQSAACGQRRECHAQSHILTTACSGPAGAGR
jgi:hypothetical protein